MDRFSVVTTPPNPPHPPVFRVLASNGVFEARATPLGSFVVRMDSLIGEMSEGFHPTLPRPGADVLARIVNIFKARPAKEALISVVYDNDERDFKLVWQGEHSTRSSVNYDPVPDDERFILYAEIHSHNTLPAFFSATDDSSETATGLYGVIGRITDPKPAALFRYACGGMFRRLPPEALFTTDPATGQLPLDLVRDPAPEKSL